MRFYLLSIETLHYTNALKRKQIKYCFTSSSDHPILTLWFIFRIKANTQTVQKYILLAKLRHVGQFRNLPGEFIARNIHLYSARQLILLVENSCHRYIITFGFKYAMHIALSGKFSGIFHFPLAVLCFSSKSAYNRRRNNNQFKNTIHIYNSKHHQSS